MPRTFHLHPVYRIPRVTPAASVSLCLVLVGQLCSDPGALHSPVSGKGYRRVCLSGSEPSWKGLMPKQRAGSLWALLPHYLMQKRPGLCLPGGPRPKGVSWAGPSQSWPSLYGAARAAPVTVPALCLGPTGLQVSAALGSWLESCSEADGACTPVPDRQQPGAGQYSGKPQSPAPGQQCPAAPGTCCGLPGLSSPGSEGWVRWAAVQVPGCNETGPGGFLVL